MNTKIKLMQDSAYAPYGYILARQRDDGSFDTRDERNTILVRTDWDWPGVADTFGWSCANLQHDGRDCSHSGTDGTIDCRECGYTAGEFIASAGQYLDDHLGSVVDDPGHFDADREFLGNGGTEPSPVT